MNHSARFTYIFVYIYWEWEGGDGRSRNNKEQKNNQKRKGKFRKRIRFEGIIAIVEVRGRNLKKEYEKLRGKLRLSNANTKFRHGGELMGERYGGLSNQNKEKRSRRIMNTIIREDVCEKMSE